MANFSPDRGPTWFATSITATFFDTFWTGMG